MLIAIISYVVFLDYKDHNRNVEMSEKQKSCEHEWRCENYMYHQDESDTYYRCHKCCKLIRDYEYERILNIKWVLRKDV